MDSLREGTGTSMRFVIFGLSLSSSWGNGHATLWRGLLSALGERGHSAIFYEKDVAYYAQTRDGWTPPRNIHLSLYSEFEDIVPEVRTELCDADVAIVTSYCPEGSKVSGVVMSSQVALKVFYDLDTPVTLDSVQAGLPVPYLPVEGLRDFDLVLSYTGGRALTELHDRLGARRVRPLYGWVDPEIHRPAPALAEFRATLNYLGTYAADRQPALEELFMKPARESADERFVIGGAQYPADFPWSKNIYFVRHLPPALHAAFFCSGRATLNVTRRAMAAYGYCPSGRLFEAAACGVAILSDVWDGLDRFFEPGKEILPVSTGADVMRALSLSDGELQQIGEAGAARVLRDHTAHCRAMELEKILDEIGGSDRAEMNSAMSV